MKIYHVTNLNDYGDGSLRFGILYANENIGTTIQFQCRGKILLHDDLPVIQWTIKINGGIGVEIDGCHQYNIFVLKKTRGCELNHLKIMNSAQYGILFQKCSQCKVSDCYLINHGKSGIGIMESEFISIGHNLVKDEYYFSNRIIGNSEFGIMVSKSIHCSVKNNLVGCETDGITSYPNGKGGIWIESSQNIQIGGQTNSNKTGIMNQPGNKKSIIIRPLDGNVVSGNKGNGISLIQSLNCVLEGNFIGITSKGNHALKNHHHGIYMHACMYCDIRGTCLNTSGFSFYNVISGNGRSGIYFIDSKYMTVTGNFIGLSANHDRPIPNESGIVVEKSCEWITIGGIHHLGNIISGNETHGITLKKNAMHISILGNRIGVSTIYTEYALPNHGSGVFITNEVNQILLQSNQISGNQENGIMISGKSHNISIINNSIGLEKSNGEDGIMILENANHIECKDKNIVSNNLGFGIFLKDFVHHIKIKQCLLGLEETESTLHSNKKGGIYITDEVQDGWIEGNRICDENDGIHCTKKTSLHRIQNNIMNMNKLWVVNRHQHSIVNSSPNNIIYNNHLPKTDP